MTFRKSDKDEKVAISYVSFESSGQILDCCGGEYHSDELYGND